MCELPEDKTTQPRMWQCSLDMTPKAQLTKVKTNWTSQKFKKSRQNQQSKGSPQNEDILGNHTSDRRLTSKIYGELLKLNNKTQFKKGRRT